MSDFVFGYGSLVDEARLRSYLSGHDLPYTGGHLACMVGHIRTWSVAMDNSQDIPGYKRYWCPEVGDFPDIFVTFLNLEPAADHAVHGWCFSVSAKALALLDQRERNYDRIDVSAHIEARATGMRIWAYIGSNAGKARYEEGIANGRAVIAQSYWDGVHESFAGRDLLNSFEASTRPPIATFRELQTVPV